MLILAEDLEKNKRVQQLYAGHTLSLQCRVLTLKIQWPKMVKTKQVTHHFIANCACQRPRPAMLKQVE